MLSGEQFHIPFFNILEPGIRHADTKPGLMALFFPQVKRMITVLFENLDIRRCQFYGMIDQFLLYVHKVIFDSYSVRFPEYFKGPF